MTALKAELVRLIAEEGPIPISRFMALCLGHPRHGYYWTRDPFGAAELGKSSDPLQTNAKRTAQKPVAFKAEI